MPEADSADPMSERDRIMVEVVVALRAWDARRPETLAVAQRRLVDAVRGLVDRATRNAPPELERWCAEVKKEWGLS